MLDQTAGTPLASARTILDATAGVHMAALGSPHFGEPVFSAALAAIPTCAKTTSRSTPPRHFSIAPRRLWHPPKVCATRGRSGATSRRARTAGAHLPSRA